MNRTLSIAPFLQTPRMQDRSDSACQAIKGFVVHPACVQFRFITRKACGFGCKPSIDNAIDVSRLGKGRKFEPVWVRRRPICDRPSLNDSVDRGATYGRAVRTVSRLQTRIIEWLKATCQSHNSVVQYFLSSSAPARLAKLLRYDRNGKGEDCRQRSGQYRDPFRTGEADFCRDETEACRLHIALMAQAAINGQTR